MPSKSVKSENHNFLPTGKLPAKFMENILKKYLTPSLDIALTEHIILPPKMGQDVAVIDMGKNSDKYLVLKSDPITFVTEHIGSYVVDINVNDIVTSGATPLGFQATILLPEKKTNKKMVEIIFSDMRKACDKYDIVITGGHTEITVGLDRPIISGTMWGEVDKNKLITTFGGKPGDVLLLTKGISIEGAYIIASEKEQELLDKNIDPSLIKQCKKLIDDPGINIVKEAQLLYKNFEIHAMHDPTEGGLAMGAIELVNNSNCGVELDYKKIPFIPGVKELCKVFDMDPLGLIASGCLLLAVPNSNNEVDEIISFISSHGINIAKIGELTPNKNEYLIRDDKGKLQKLKYSAIDEITKIY